MKYMQKITVATFRTLFPVKQSWKKNKYYIEQYNCHMSLYNSHVTSFYDTDYMNISQPLITTYCSVVKMWPPFPPPLLLTHIQTEVHTSWFNSCNTTMNLWLSETFQISIDHSHSPCACVQCHMSNNECI